MCQYIWVAILSLKIRWVDEKILIDGLDDLKRMEEDYIGKNKKGLDSEQKRQFRIRMRKIADLPVSG